MGSKRDIEEIEVDINAPKPLNKKQKRLLKKGKIDAPEPEDILAKKQPKPRSQFAVWIGNLSFETTTDDLRNFIVDSTAQLKSPVTLEDITRIKLPSRKGFAYVDLKTEEQMNQIIGLSESRVGNRSLLIKNASSFDGRPAEHIAGQKNAPSRILFVGNLSFDTTDEQLEQQFQHCGEIRRIRTATFQDTGKCKGFSFIDFKTEDAAMNAIKDPSCRKLHGRSLRMEFGEDRSQRRPARSGEIASGSRATDGAEDTTNAKSESFTHHKDAHSHSSKPFTPRKEIRKVGKYRPTPGAALSGAERAKSTVVPSTGKKLTFD